MGSMRVAVNEYEACLCARPVPGYRIVGRTPCRRCNLFIVHRSHIAHLRRKAEIGRIERFRKARSRSRGGLHVDGSSSSGMMSLRRPAASRLGGSR